MSDTTAYVRESLSGSRTPYRIDTIYRSDTIRFESFFKHVREDRNAPCGRSAKGEGKNGDPTQLRHLEPIVDDPRYAKDAILLARRRIVIWAVRQARSWAGVRLYQRALGLVTSVQTT
jgi:hypothetical protein